MLIPRNIVSTMYVINIYIKWEITTCQEMYYFNFDLGNVQKEE